MTAMAGTDGRKSLNWKIAAFVFLGALVGAGAGAGSVQLARSLNIGLKGLRWSDGLGWWLGITFFVVGIGHFVMSFNRKTVAQSLEGWNAKLPATRDEVSMFRLQAASLALAGLMLLLTFYGRGMVNTGRQWVVYGAIVCLFAVQAGANLSLWRRGDEFVRHQMLVVSTVTFWIVQSALFLWAAAERMHLARPVTTWDSVTLLLLVYLVVSVYLALKYRPRME